MYSLFDVDDEEVKKAKRVNNNILMFCLIKK